MNRQTLVENIRTKKSVLCVGLDTDLTKIPRHLLKEENPALAFNKAIIDATKEVAVCYKINTAFYEAQGIRGWETIEKTLAYIPENCFTIADAKRGDIGNTSEQYAKTFFETFPFDSVTVAPYMGEDSVKPFLQFEGKWAIVLGLTSNKGSHDFQLQQMGEQQLYERVFTKVMEWGSEENLMFVVGATQSSQLKNVRKICPNHFFLIPGVGAQGGDVATVCSHALNENAGILINVSRSVIYAGNDEHFAEKAHDEGQKLQQQMAVFL
jgi:orotidine-5'-phosphate decarboxylase